MYVANETITNLNYHIYFLQTMRACRDATEYYEREIAAGRCSSARNLYYNAFANFKASNTSDEQKKDLIQKIMEIESTMIETRNDLNRKLVEINVVLRSKVGKNARALRMAKKEKESLQKKIEDAEEELQKCRETEDLKRLAQLEDEIQKQKFEITKEAKKEAAAYRGHALATTHSLLVSLSHTKFEVAIKIVDNVFERLKDIDSKEKATRAIHTINGYLERQSKTVEDYTANVMSNSTEVQELIRDLQSCIPKEARPGDLVNFIEYVRGLQHKLEAEAK
ncbi:hypothetical protein J3E71DRAFT_377810 [Bipolaris maydis]|nr:hypothetical protein J3E71DRAFT_377810 [Bipolaris maydis]